MNLLTNGGFIYFLQQTYGVGRIKTDRKLSEKPKSVKYVDKIFSGCNEKKSNLVKPVLKCIERNLDD